MGPTRFPRDPALMRSDFSVSLKCRIGVKDSFFEADNDRDPIAVFSSLSFLSS